MMPAIEPCGRRGLGPKLEPSLGYTREVGRLSWPASFYLSMSARSPIGTFATCWRDGLPPTQQDRDASRGLIPQPPISATERPPSGSFFVFGRDNCQALRGGFWPPALALHRWLRPGFCSGGGNALPDEYRS